MRTAYLILPGLSLVVWLLLVKAVFASHQAVSLPAAPRPQGNPAEVRPLPRIWVKEFRFQGKLILAEAELRRLAAPYQGRTLTWQELEGLRQQLSAHLVQQGYLNSGVQVNDQQVKAGVITFTVVAGTLSTITIDNHSSFRTSYLQKRIAQGAVSPLNVTTLQQNLQLLQQDPRINKITAELRPGTEIGEGLLAVQVEENPPWTAGVSVDNGRSPAIGDLHGQLTLTRQNLLGIGDTLQGAYGLTDGGSSDYSLAGSLPLTSSDTMITIHTARTETVLVEEPFSDLNIVYQTTLWRAGVTHPFVRRPDREFRLGLAFDHKENESFLLGRPFAFFAGTDEGRGSLAIWRFSQEFAHRGARRVMALSSSFSQGENRSLAEDPGPGVDKRFFSWSGQGKLVVSHWLFGRESQAVLQSALQLTRASLLPSERFSLGGMNSVRGYRENSYLRDNGIFASLELRVPLLTNPRADALTATLVPFLDAARGWNSEQGVALGTGIIGTGVGLLLSKKRWFECRVFYGIPLGHRDTTGNSWQDRGVHVQVRLWR